MVSTEDNFLRKFRDVTSRQFHKFTAAQFMEVWNHYDQDGDGYIDGQELDGFLREFVGSVNPEKVGPEAVSDAAFKHLRDAFMDAFDENGDNKIDINELAQILPMDENFLLLFRRQVQLESSVEFMKIWKQFDKDCSGYIESDELKEFLRHLLKLSQRSDIDDRKLDEYTQALLMIFDANKDGKLQLSEMARLLPVKDNYLSRPLFKGASKITDRLIDRLFAFYDKDKNGSIEDEELSGFLKDLVEMTTNVSYDSEDISSLQTLIMEHWDVNNDGRINKAELKMLLLQQSSLINLSSGGTSECDNSNN